VTKANTVYKNITNITNIIPQPEAIVVRKPYQYKPVDYLLYPETIFTKKQNPEAKP